MPTMNSTDPTIPHAFWPAAPAAHPVAGWRPMTGTGGLIALLEQPGTGDPGVRQVTRALRRTPRHLADQFDHWQTIVDAVGPARAAHMVVNAARAAHKGWLAG